MLNKKFKFYIFKYLLRIYNFNISLISWSWLIWWKNQNFWFILFPYKKYSLNYFKNDWKKCIWLSKDLIIFVPLTFSFYLEIFWNFFKYYKKKATLIVKIFDSFFIYHLSFIHLYNKFFVKIVTFWWIY